MTRSAPAFASGIEVGGIAERGEDDERETVAARQGADLAAQGDAVDAGHHHVADDQVGEAVAEEVERRLRIAGGEHLELLHLQVERDDVHQPGIVVDEEDARTGGSHGHVRILRPIGALCPDLIRL